MAGLLGRVRGSDEYRQDNPMDKLPVRLAVSVKHNSSMALLSGIRLHLFEAGLKQPGFSGTESVLAIKPALF